MKQGKLNFLMGGPAGSGIEKAGNTLTLSFVRGGYYVFANIEHMSQIRGGNNFLRVRIDERPHESHIEEIDVMVALDRQTIDEHIGEMVEGGAVIFDNEVLKLPGDYDAGKAVLLDLPMKKLATEELGNPIMANTIALGAVCGLIGFDVVVVKAVLQKVFGGKAAAIIQANEKAVDLGVKLAREKYSGEFPVNLPRKEALNAMFLNGNDALCMGGLKAGVKFVGEYPMTPSSSVLHFMAKWAEKYGVVVKHTEDEIAAVNSLIGAGLVGVRAMAATAGGGFALMTEGIGLASMNEVPIVVAVVMRPGPATGLPTRTSQGDLRQVIHAGQDDPVKIVLLPGDPKECFRFAFEAFNLAEKYQLPVIVTYDKNLGEGVYTEAPFDETGLKIERGKVLSEEELAKMEDFKRYAFMEDGVSPRSLPGMKGGMHRSTSDEHNEYGEICEVAENRRKMVEKRMKKLQTALTELPKPLLMGEEDAEITFVTWASGKGTCVEVVELLAEKGVKANIVQIRTAWPFHKKEVKEMLSGRKRLVMVEENFDAQMAGLIAEQTGIMINERVLRYDGRPMTAKYVLDKLGL